MVSLKVLARGNRFQVFIDNKKMLDFLDDTYVEGESIYRQGMGTAFTSTTLKFGGWCPCCAASEETHNHLGTDKGRISLRGSRTDSPRFELTVGQLGRKINHLFLDRRQRTLI